eukprot:TRINITY_DN67030_c0_g1_i1.p1 TRINITY_DN67030_c0_g1~~TRINITY_DN67030_c0_g1_i1.p1  ORF type:complete len:222 (+),score=89.56 TRINITY_DN67030_c0_g1_i1:94-666(+)
MRAAAAVALLCAGSYAAGEADASKWPQPESAWLTKESLLRMTKELGYDSAEIRMNYVTIPVKGKDDGEERTIYAWWGDMDSLSITASWGSKMQIPKLNGPAGDAPIANTWNAQRRFCKVSIQADPENDAGSQLMMHLDQFAATAGGESNDYDAAKDVVGRSVNIFRHCILEFDDYIKRSYADWMKAAGGA